jgi:hypothetical protein
MPGLISYLTEAFHLIYLYNHPKSRPPFPSPRSQEVQHIDPAQFRLPIVSVALLPARHDVFDRSVVHSVLAVATPIDVVLMAVVFPQQSVDSASFSGIELVPSAAKQRFCVDFRGFSLYACLDSALGSCLYVVLHCFIALCWTHLQIPLLVSCFAATRSRARRRRAPHGHRLAADSQNVRHAQRAPLSVRRRWAPVRVPVRSRRRAGRRRRLLSATQGAQDRSFGLRHVNSDEANKVHQKQMFSRTTHVIEEEPFWS